MTIETANRLYELRKKHNLSQEELAEKLGVSRQAVSKWERSEASPDTDNIIALAKIYGLSLDELIYGEKETTEEQAEETAEETSKEETSEEDVVIDVKEDDKHVIVTPWGVTVKEKDGKTVNVSLRGIKIETSDDDDDDDDDEDDEDESNNDDKVYVSGDGKVKIKVNVDKSDFCGANFWRNVPYPLICSILYLWFGFTHICGGWGRAWILFLTIPVYFSIVDAISKRKMSEFAYPVFALCVFFYLGMYMGIWHPSWLVFLSVPVYEFIASAVDSGFKRVK